MVTQLLAYAPNGIAALTAAGVHVSGAVTFAGTETSDSLELAEATWALNQMVDVTGPLCVTLKPFPDPDAGELWQAAHGVFDDYWRGCIAVVKTFKASPLYVRNFHELQVPGSPWDFAHDPINGVLAWNRFEAMLAAERPDAILVCCVGAGPGTLNNIQSWMNGTADPAQAPAMKYGAIGLDLYRTPNPDPVANWNWIKSQMAGSLDSWDEFAKAQNKPLCLPEWGGFSGIDDTAWVTNTVAWAQSVGVLFIGTFEANGQDTASKPNALKALAAAFPIPAPVQAVAPHPSVPTGPTKAQAAAAWALWMRRLAWQGACSQADADAALATVQAFFAAP